MCRQLTCDEARLSRAPCMDARRIHRTQRDVSGAVYRALSVLRDSPLDAVRAPWHSTRRSQDPTPVHRTLSGVQHSHGNPPARRAVGRGGRLLRTGCHRWGQGGPVQPLDPAPPNKGRPRRLGSGQCSSAGGGGSGSGAPSQKRHHR